jgi:hypothetical protein
MLSTLKLNNCDVNNDGLKIIADALMCTTLTSLDIGYTYIDADGLQHISNMKQLSTLGLANIYCNVHNVVNFKVLVDLPLTDLDISYGDTTFGILDIIEVMPLKNLTMCGARADISPQCKMLSTLTSLSIPQCWWIDSLSNVTRLTYLDVSGVELNDLAMDIISSLPLIALIMKYTDHSRGRASVKKYKRISKCTNLTELNISMAPITDTHLVSFRMLPLKVLNVEYCPNITQVGINYIKETHPGIQVFA